MQPEAGRPCLKLMIRDITANQDGFSFEGLPYDRVWVQGTVKRKVNAAFLIGDGTGEILVAVPSAVSSHDLAAGTYALVVGKLIASGAKTQPHIKAHKIVNLSADQDSAGQRMLHWNSEVVELQRKVYPLMAAAPGNSQ